MWVFEALPVQRAAVGGAHLTAGFLEFTPSVCRSQPLTCSQALVLQLNFCPSCFFSSLAPALTGPFTEIQTA